MFTRRQFVSTGVLGFAAISLTTVTATAQGASQTFYEQGDPEGELKTIAFDPEYVSSLINVPRPAFKIPDPLPDFGSALIEAAKAYNDMDRWNNQSEVTAMLGLFGCPFKDNNGHYLAFCAAGVGYCAALAFAKATNRPTDINTLRDLLPIVDIWNYYPSPGMLNMSEVARGKSRWVERSVTSKPGWLVIFDWSASDNPERTSHTGIVLGSNGENLNTFEFNTGNSAHPEGGTIGYKTCKLDKTVKGYINTSSRSIRPSP